MRSDKCFNVSEVLEEFGNVREVKWYILLTHNEKDWDHL